MKQMGAFALALTVLTLIVAIVLTLVAVPGTPAPWVLIGVLIALPFLHKRLMARRFLDWQERYSVGIPALDTDHRRLLSLVNQFQTAAYYSTDPGFVLEALDALVHYTKTHFRREEELMMQHHYPGYAGHLQEHQQMIEKVDALVARYRKAPQETVEEALAFLKEWLIHHIGGSDQQYAGFFRERGVTSLVESAREREPA